MEEQAPPDPGTLFLARALKCGAPDNLDKALAKYWVWMQEFPPKLTVEPGYGLRLVGTAAAGEELTEFHKYGPLFVLTYEDSALFATCTLRRNDGVQPCDHKIKLGKADIKCSQLKSHLTNGHQGKMFFGADNKHRGSATGGSSRLPLTPTTTPALSLTLPFLSSKMVV